MGTKKWVLASFRALTPSPIMEGAQTANMLVNTTKTMPRNNRPRYFQIRGFSASRAFMGWGSTQNEKFQDTDGKMGNRLTCLAWISKFPSNNRLRCQRTRSRVGAVVQVVNAEHPTALHFPVFEVLFGEERR